MSNRRMGGMGGLNRGNNRSFSQQPFQGGLNPWQGGGPMQTNQGGGLLSQLTANPQQLALALTSLLQSPQQQQMNPPSLLSLNTSPAFSNQNRDFNDRFGNRGRDIRRHEPYNKNQNRPGGGPWRQMDRGGNRNNNQRNQGNRKRSPQRDNRKDDKNKKDDKDKKDIKPAEKKKAEKDKESGAENVELSMDEDKEDAKESKRDWKDEKNQSEDKKGNETGDEDDSTENDKKNKEGKYSGVAIKFLNCFVCNKEMWDGESMWKHINGRAHGQMLKSLEESIHITVNILRENMRLVEDKKMIERNRVHRLKKFNKYNEDIESHCNMCDLKFMGKILSHRRTLGHQRLKRYLHPDCKICDKEFPSRMDWIEHRLTPEHLKKLSSDLNSKLGGSNGMDIFKVEEENLEPLLEEPLQMEVENPILEVDDNLENLQNLMPAYKKDRAIATKSLKPFTGFMCELCNRSFENEEIAQAHLKTPKHYYTFVGVIKDKHKKDSTKKDKKEEKKVKTEDAEEKEEEQESNMYDPEEATNEEVEEEEEDATVNNSTVKEEDEEEEAGDPSSISLNNSQLQEDVEMTEAESEEKKEEDEILKSEDEEPVEAKKPKLEPVKKEETASPAKVTRPVRGNVKNGAGPKSKKLAAAAAAPTKETETPANAANYRIPKVAPKTPLKKK